MSQLADDSAVRVAIDAREKARRDQIRADVYRRATAPTVNSQRTDTVPDRPGFPGYGNAMAQQSAPPAVDDAEIDRRADSLYQQDVRSRIAQVESRMAAKIKATVDEVVQPRPGEEPRATEARRQNQLNWVLQQKGIAPISMPDRPVGELGMMNEAGRSALRFGYSTVGALAGSLPEMAGTVGQALSPPGSPQRAGFGGLQRGGRYVRETMGEGAAGFPPSDSVTMQGFLPDNAGSVPRWLAARGPEAVGSVGVSLLPGIGIGGKLGAAAAMATGTAMEAGTTYDDAYRSLVAQGVPPDQAAKHATVEASIYGAVSGALEKFPAAEFILKDRTAMSRVLRAARGAFIEGSTESAQELAQGLTQTIGGSAPDAMDEIGSRMAASGILGAIPGGGLGMVTGGNHEALPQKQGQTQTQTTVPPPPTEPLSEVDQARAMVNAGKLTPEQAAHLAELIRQVEAEEQTPPPAPVVAAPTEAPAPTQGDRGGAAGQDATATTDVPRGNTETGVVDQPPPAPPVPTVDQPARPRFRKAARGEGSDAQLVAEIMADGGDQLAAAMDDAYHPMFVSDRAAAKPTYGTPATWGDSGGRNNRRDSEAIAATERMNPMVRANLGSEDVVSTMGGVDEAVKAAEYAAGGDTERTGRVLSAIRRGAGVSPQAAVNEYTIRLRNGGPTEQLDAIDSPAGLPEGTTFAIAGRTHEVVTDADGHKVFHEANPDATPIPLEGVRTLRVDRGTLDPTGASRGDLDARAAAAENVDDLPFSLTGEQSRTAPTVTVQPKTAAERQAVEVGKALGLQVELFDGGDAAVNGVFDPANPQRLQIRRGEKNAVRRVLTHEWTHALRTNSRDAYDSLVSAIKRADPEGLRRFAERYKQMARDAGMNDLLARLEAAPSLLEEEAVAEMMAHHAGTAGFWSALARENATVWDKIVDALRRIVTRLGLRGGVARELLRTIEKATAGHGKIGKGDGGVRLSIDQFKMDFGAKPGEQVASGRQGGLFRTDEPTVIKSNQIEGGKSREQQWAEAYDRMTKAERRAYKLRHGVPPSRTVVPTEIDNELAQPDRKATPAERNTGKLFSLAWHGSPHEFDKFSTDKIGTGEGAQSFGYGLYFTDKEEVARWYKDKLSRKLHVKLAGVDSAKMFAHDAGRFKFPELSTDQFDQLSSAVAGFDAALNRGDVSSVGEYIRLLDDRAIDARESDRAKSAEYFDGQRNLLDRFQGKLEIVKGSGRLYKVDLKPAEDEYLLWDKPLSEQSEKVQKALISINFPYRESEQEAFGGHLSGGPDKSSGADIYHGLTYNEMWGPSRSKQPEAAASAKLRSLGIRGIKYLDGASRGLGKGHYNYVIFDANDVSIEEKRFSLSGQKAAKQAQQTATGKEPVEDPRGRVNPGKSPGGKRAIDALREALQQFNPPASRPDAAIRTEAARKLAKDYAGERARLIDLAGKGGMPTDTDMRTMRSISVHEAAVALRSNTPQAWQAATEAQHAYNRFGAMASRAFAQRQVHLGGKRTHAELMQETLVHDLLAPSHQFAADTARHEKAMAKLEQERDSLRSKLEAAEKAAEKSGAENEAARAELQKRLKQLDRRESDLKAMKERAMKAEAELNARIARDLAKFNIDVTTPIAAAAREVAGDVRAASGAGPAPTNYKGQTDLAGHEESGALTVKNGPDTPRLEGTGVDKFGVGLQKNIPGMDGTFEGTDGPKGVADEATHLRLLMAAMRGRRIVQAAKGNVWDRFYEFWVNGLISGVRTIGINISTNTVYGAYSTFGQRFADAMVNLALGPNPLREGATLSEFSAMARTIAPALRKAWLNAVDTFRNEMPVFEDEINWGQGLTTHAVERTVAIPGKLGRGVRVPSRVSMMADEFNKTLWGTLHAAALAHRHASTEGLKGDALWNRVGELMGDISHPLWFAALHEAKRVTFQEDLERLGLFGKMAHGVTSLRNAVPGVRYLFPFVRTPTNLVFTGLGHTPLASAAMLYKLAHDGIVSIRKGASGDYYYRGNRSALANDISRNLVAWGMFLALGSLAAGDDKDGPYITGTNQLAPGIPKTSIRIGGKWYNYGYLEPMASMLSLTVDLSNNLMRGGPRTALRGVTDSISDTANRLSDSVPMLTGIANISDLIESMRNRGSAGAHQSAVRWAGQFTASWVPNFIRSGLQAADPNVRDYRTLGIKGDSGAWGGFTRTVAYRALGRLSPLDPPSMKYDLWGRAVQRDAPGFGPVSDWAFRVLSPASGTPRNIGTEARMDRLIMNWNQRHPDVVFAPKPPDPFFDKGGKSVPMTEREWETLQHESGRAAVMRLGRMRLNDAKPTATDIKDIQNEISRARREVRDRLWASRERAKS